MFSKIKAKNLSDSGIIFVRRYPFYCSVQNQKNKKIQKTAESFYFKVTVSALAPLDQRTGMTVNLVLLDQVAKKIFKINRPSKLALNKYLENQFKKLGKALKLKKIGLTSLQFDECRGFCLKFQDQKIFSIHSDYATDEKGNLFQVSSQFNEKDDLVELDIKNLKLDIHEKIIF